MSCYSSSLSMRNSVTGFCRGPLASALFCQISFLGLSLPVLFCSPCWFPVFLSSVYRLHVSITCIYKLCLPTPSAPDHPVPPSQFSVCSLLLCVFPSVLVTRVLCLPFWILLPVQPYASGSTLCLIVTVHCIFPIHHARQTCSFLSCT